MRAQVKRTDARGRRPSLRRALACVFLTLLAAALLPVSASGSFPARRACADPGPGRAACLAMRIGLPAPPASAQPLGAGLSATSAGERTKPYPGFLTPELLHDAYELPNETPEGSTQTIAVVDAYDDPTAEADLAVYDKQFGLPECTSANGCFRKVNQEGEASPLPKPSGAWASEISIDVQMAHAICQNCKVLLVETRTEEFSDLGAGVDAAAKLGATEISNSYGGTEEASVAGLATAHYDHPGVVVTASSGDCGYLNTACPEEPVGAEFPAGSPTVLAVGGTSLSESAGGWSSSAWAEGGSGCSEVFEAALWQPPAAGFPATGCGTSRAIADVAAIGNPSTGVDVYDSTPETPGGPTGWGAWGGTSVSSPIVAAEFALAGGANGVAYPASTLYAHAGEASLYDVTSGADGECQGRTICAAAAGFDGPTGVGSPVGLGAFTVAGAPQPASPPGISGFAEEGDTVTATHGGWTGEPTGYAYQWERCGFSGGGCKTLAGATGQALVVPQGAAGYTLRVRETARNANGPNSAVSAAIGPIVSDVPLISAVSPLTAITGATIVVEGAALDQASTVTVAGLPAAFEAVSPAKLSVDVPDGAFKGKVVVTTPHGSATSKQKFAATLAVRSIAPAQGLPGTLVTVKGIGFNAGSQVSFGGAAANVLKRSAKKLVVMVPVGAQPGPLAVTNTAAPVGTVYSAASFNP